MFPGAFPNDESSEIALDDPENNLTIPIVMAINNITIVNTMIIRVRVFLNKAAMLSFFDAMIITLPP